MTPFNRAPVALGIGKSFDLTKIPAYKTFTDNNFIVEPVNFPEVNYRIDTSNEGSTAVYRGLSIKKSYNASTGILSAYCTVLSRTLYPVGYGNVTVDVKAYYVK